MKNVSVITIKKIKELGSLISILPHPILFHEIKLLERCPNGYEIRKSWVDHLAQYYDDKSKVEKIRELAYFLFDDTGYYKMYQILLGVAIYECLSATNTATANN